MKSQEIDIGETDDLIEAGLDKEKFDDKQVLEKENKSSQDILVKTDLKLEGKDIPSA